MQKYRALVDFGAIFPPGGTPGASRAPLGAQVGSQVDFLMVFRRAPLGPFGLLWASLGRPWASLCRLKWTQESEKERLWCTLRSRVDFGSEKGGARTFRM